MADDPLNVHHKIRLSYDEEIRSTISGHLQGLQKELNQVDKAFNKHHKGIGKTSTTTKGAAKATAVAAAKMGGMSKMAFSAGKALGTVNLAATGAFKALAMLGGAIIGIIELSDAMVRFAAISGEGASAVTTLRDSYWGMAEATAGANISLRDLAESMSKFASLGFPQQMLAAEASMQTAIGSMQDSLTKALSDPKAADALTQSLFKATSGDLPIMREFRDAINAAGSDITKLAVVVRDVRFSQLDDAAFREAAGALDMLFEKSQGGVDGAVSAFTSWRNVINRLTAAFSNIGQVILEAIGQDMAGALQGVEKMVVDVVSNMRGWIDTIKEIWVITKVVVNNYVETWKMGWNAISGFLKIAIAGWTLGIGKFVSWIPGEFGKAGEAMQAWGDELGKSGEASFKALTNPKFLDFNDELAKHYAEQNKLLKSGKKAIGDNVEATDPMIAKMRALRDEVLLILPAVESWGKSLEKSARLTDSLAKLTALVGSRYTIMGKQIGEVTEGAAKSQIGLAKALLDSASDEALSTAQQLVTHYETLRAEGDKDAGTAKSLATAQEDVSKIIEERVRAYSKLKAIQDQLVAGIKADLTLTEKSRQLSQAQLSVVQAVYGTPALAVGPMLAIVKTMEQEKNLIGDMIVKQQKYLNYLESQGIAGRDLQFAQERMLELQTQHTQKTAEQLNLVKQLRDGYLDAVQAQAFGAGRFSKILITQEKNIMRGLQKRIAKENYLLGQYGDAAGAANASPMRFMGNKLGMETMSGQEVTPAMASREQERRIAGVSARQAGAARDADKITRGIISAADKNIHDKAMADMKRGRNLVGGNIDRMASEGSIAAATGLALKGGAARPGITAHGEAMRTGAGLKASNAKRYAPIPNAKRTSRRYDPETSVGAMLNFNKPGTDKVEPGFDVTLANKFNVDALVYYQKFLDALGKCCSLKPTEKLAGPPAPTPAGAGAGAGAGVRAAPGAGAGAGNLALVAGVAGVAAGGTAVAVNQAVKMAVATVKAPLKALGLVTRTIANVAKYDVMKPLNAVGRGAQTAGRGAQAVVSGLRGAQAVGVAPYSSAPWQAAPKPTSLARQAGQTTARVATRGAQAVRYGATAVRTLASTQMPSVATGATSFLPAATAAGAIGTGAAAGVAAGSIYTLGKSIQVASDEKLALSAQKRAMEDDRLFWAASKNKESDDELIRLKGKRQEIDAMLLTNAAAGTKVEGNFAWIAEKLGFMANVPEMDDTQKKQLGRLRDQRREIQDRMNVIKSDRGNQKNLDDQNARWKGKDTAFREKASEDWGVTFGSTPSRSRGGTIGKGGGNMQSKMNVVTQILGQLAAEVDQSSASRNVGYAGNRGKQHITP